MFTKHFFTIYQKANSSLFFKSPEGLKKSEMIKSELQLKNQTKC